jgi:predicted nucleotide-binding protein
MAKSTVPGSERAITPEQGLILLEEQKVLGEALTFRSEKDENLYFSWIHTTLTYIKKAFGEDSSQVTHFDDFGPVVTYPERSRQFANLAKCRDSHLVALEGLIEQLKKEIELGASAVRNGSLVNPVVSRRVFLVHGRDGEAKHTVARFLEKLDLKPVILEEQPNKGRSILQKFSDYSDVGFVVVLLTGDDIGGPSGTASSDLNHRARQNVIFELGFFLGKYPPERVCVLYEKDVEPPSDFHGIGYVPYDASEGWKTKLAREISASGIEIDLNKTL